MFQHQVLHSSCPGGIKLTEDVFDTIVTKKGDKIQVKRFTLTNKSNMTVEIINYGAIVTAIKIPDKNGVLKNVTLGYDNMSGYTNPRNPYFGSVVGRVANRIREGKFTLEGKEYSVTKNRGNLHLHGGAEGFDKKLWSTHVDGNRLVLTYLSEDGEEGYPGQVLVQAIYQLSNDNELIFDMRATSTKPTPINLTNHSYFNLAGHNEGRKGIAEHTICINADKYTEVDGDSIPTGNFTLVGGTAMDLRVAQVLGEVLSETGGIDHNYCINQSSKGGLTFVARAVHPPSGIVMEVYSDQPGVQFYTGNFLPDSSQDAITGKEGAAYRKQGGFCLETQNFPDAVNHGIFPSSILNPGYTYAHTVIYRFV